MATADIKTSDVELREYLGQVSRFKPLDSVEEARALALSRAGDMASRRNLVESYLSRVVAWTQGSRGGDLRFQDLIELGNREMIKALDAAPLTGVLEVFLEARVKGAVSRKLAAN